MDANRLELCRPFQKNINITYKQGIKKESNYKQRFYKCGNTKNERLLQMKLDNLRKKMVIDKKKINAERKKTWALFAENATLQKEFATLKEKVDTEIIEIKNRFSHEQILNDKVVKMIYDDIGQAIGLKEELVTLEAKVDSAVKRLIEKFNDDQILTDKTVKFIYEDLISFQYDVSEAIKNPKNGCHTDKFSNTTDSLCNNYNLEQKSSADLNQITVERLNNIATQRHSKIRPAYSYNLPEKRNVQLQSNQRNSNQLPNKPVNLKVKSSGHFHQTNSNGVFQVRCMLSCICKQRNSGSFDSSLIPVS